MRWKNLAKHMNLSVLKRVHSAVEIFIVWQKMPFIKVNLVNNDGTSLI